MKTLHSCNVPRLQQMELVTLLRETTADVETAAGNLKTTDVPLKRYLKETKDGIDPFETATRNPTKDPDTEVMHKKDSERDKAVSRFVLKFQSFRLSEDSAEQTAYNNLQILWARHRNVQGLNNENQTGATDNLLNDLKKEPFASAVTKLHLEAEVTGIQTTNDAFRTFMGGRRAVVTERRLGCIKEVMGQTTYPTSPGEIMISITVKTEGRDGASITFESRSGHPLRAYRKQVLSNRQQKRWFGRIIYPSSGVFGSLPGAILQAVLYIVGVGVIFKIFLYFLYLM